MQLFPQIEKEMVQVLKVSLDHYEQLKLMEDMLKEDAQSKKVQTLWLVYMYIVGNRYDVIVMS